MAQRQQDHPNLRQTAPLFGVSDIAASLRFYIDGLGFKKTIEWAPDGRLRWCWLQREGVALMLQEFWSDGARQDRPDGVLGLGVSIYFICADALALYHEFAARGVTMKTPFVGNGMWVVELTDPDGYRLGFESLTDAPEETEYDPALHGAGSGS